MRAITIPVITSLLAMTTSATYNFAPETFNGSYKDLGLPTIYDLASSQLPHKDSNWATNSFITSTTGDQYFVTSLYTHDGTQDVFRATTLDLRSLEFQYAFQLGNGSYLPTAPGHFKVGVNNHNGFEALSSNNYDVVRVQSQQANVTYNLTYHATTKPLINGGTGVMMFGGIESREWALPGCRTEGDLVIHGETVVVDPARSVTWYERQRGKGGFSTWTWFGFLLPETGEAFSVWAGDAEDAASSERFATVRDASGAQTVCRVILTADEKTLWEDRAAQKPFPVAWTLEIPALDAVLRIESVAKDQLVAGSSSSEPQLYNGLATVSGTSRGREMNGIGAVAAI